MKPALRDGDDRTPQPDGSPAASGIRLHFIRNVLIYFNRESKQVVIDNLVRALVQGGYLVVGSLGGNF